MLTKEQKQVRKIHQIPPFVFQSIGLAFGLVGERNQQLYARAIAPLGINDQQLFILVALENLGPQVQAHLSEPLGIDKATMVSLINELERQGLVQRQPHPNDRRAVLVHLTEGGREMMQRGFEISDRFVERFFKGISAEDQAILAKVLERLAANAAELAREFEAGE